MVVDQDGRVGIGPNDRADGHITEPTEDARDQLGVETDRRLQVRADRSERRGRLAMHRGRQPIDNGEELGTSSPSWPVRIRSRSRRMIITEEPSPTGWK